MSVIVAMGVVLGWLFQELRLAGRLPGARGTGAAADERAESTAAPLWWSTSPDPRAPAPAPLPKERPPWEATPANTPPPPKGQLPAWVVNPPRPDPNLAPPPPPVPPPDPMTQRLPAYNPGGVDGDRPERPAPGSR